MTQRLLAIKIGNSNVGLGLFEGNKLTRTWRMETRVEQTADEYGTLLLAGLDSAIQPDTLEGIALVSVVPPLTDTIREMCTRYLQREPFIVAPGMRSGIKIRYDDPRALGADRLVVLAAAFARFGGPSLVLDLGTATTFNALDAQGTFIGGAIAPGLNMSAEALHRFTAKLPRIEIAPPQHALATNTAEALRSGIFFGYAAMLEGMVLRLRAAMGTPDVRVIATGGQAHLVAPFCPAIQRVEPDLALEGLHILYEQNRART